LDAVLLVGLLITVVSGATTWLDAYWYVVATGLGKTALSGIAAAVRCWSTKDLGRPT
jgi:hypothetical protein